MIYSKNFRAARANLLRVVDPAPGFSNSQNISKSCWVTSIWLVDLSHQKQGPKDY